MWSLRRSHGQYMISLFRLELQDGNIHAGDFEVTAEGSIICLIVYGGKNDTYQVMAQGKRKVHPAFACSAFSESVE